MVRALKCFGIFIAAVCAICVFVAVVFGWCHGWVYLFHDVLQWTGWGGYVGVFMCSLIIPAAAAVAYAVCNE